MEEDEENIIEEFAKKMIEDQKDLDPEIAQLVDKHFWELL